MSAISKAKQTSRNKNYIPRKQQPPIMCRVLDKAKLGEDNDANPQKIVTFSNGTVQQLQSNGSLRTVGMLPKDIS